MDILGSFKFKSGRMRICVHLAAVCLLGAMIYANTMHAAFVFDDGTYVLGNPVINDLRGFVDTGYVEQLIGRGQLNQNFRTRIVTFFTFTINYKLFGHSLVGYHLVNLGIHLLNGILVYWLTRLSMQTPLAKMVESHCVSCGFTAMLTALLFVSHPVQTEAVTYISQRSTSLATLFYLLSLAFYISWRLTASMPLVTLEKSPFRDFTGKRLVLYGLSLLSAILAMRTKEISFTLPLMICLYEFFFIGGCSRRRWLYLLPFLLTMLIIPLIVFGEHAKYRDVDYLIGSFDKTQPGAAMGYLLTQFMVVATYLRLLILPVNQNLDYSYPMATGFFQTPVLLSFLLLTSLAGLGGYLFARSARPSEAGHAFWLRLISFGIFWFFLALSVESTFIPLADVIFEHRLYLPSVGFFLSLTAAGMIIYARCGLLMRRVLSVGIVALILVWSGAAYLRNSVWRDELTIWTDTVQKSPDKCRPHYTLGDVYYNLGRLQDAVREYEAAIMLEAVDGNGYADYRLARMYYAKGEDASALRILENAGIHKGERVVPQFYGLLGEIYLRADRLQEAEGAFNRAIQQSSQSPIFMRRLSEVYVRQKRFSEAKRVLEAASELDLS